MSGHAIPRSILHCFAANGLGRYIPQLQRLTVKFCKSRSDSQGVRDYVEHELVDFARRNPSTAIYVKPRRHRPPLLVAEYLCGSWQYVKAADMDCNEIKNWMEFLRTRSGVDILPIYKNWSTKNPSIQGMWHPFSPELESCKKLMTPEEIIKNLHVLSEPESSELTAEEELLDIADKQQHRLSD